MTDRNRFATGETGFSLLELIIAMAVTLALMTMATALLARSVNIRAGEDATLDSLADVQRALNIISREVANAGYGLSGNGIVGCDGAGCDSNATSLRVRSNLDGSSDGTVQPGEDIKYFLSQPEDLRTTYLARFDPNAAVNRSVLANRIDAIQFHYFDQKVTYATRAFDPANPGNTLLDPATVRGTSGAVVAEVAPPAARYVVVIVAVRLAAVGRPGADGYRPPRTEMLATDVALRNASLVNY